jgi:hypothetical protein
MLPHGASLVVVGRSFARCYETNYTAAGRVIRIDAGAALLLVSRR